MRVAGEHHVEADRRIVHAVVQPGARRVVTELGELVGDELGEEAREHRVARRWLGLGLGLGWVRDRVGVSVRVRVSVSVRVWVWVS